MRHADLPPRRPVLKPGDRVFVDDPALNELRRIFEKATGTAEPNHHGTVQEVRLLDGEHDALILFDDGVEAPYPLEDVYPLPPGETGGEPS